MPAVTLLSVFPKPEDLLATTPQDLGALPLDHLRRQAHDKNMRAADAAGQNADT